MEVNGKDVAFGLKNLGFLRRQSRNFNMIVARAAFSTFLVGLTSPYESIYVVMLGATTVQLGLVNSVGNAASALIALPGCNICWPRPCMPRWAC